LPEADERTPLEKLTDGIDPEVQAEVVEPVVPEPEFTIEVDGKTEIVKGADRVKELLQKGMDYSRGTAEVARVREQLIAQSQMAQAAAKFQAEAIGDIAELRALDAQLEQYSKIDWSSAIDTNFVEAMKLQQQRATLKEARDAKLNQLQQKQAQFEKGQADAAQSLRIAEENALLAKLPEWRNSEKAASEKQAIIRNLTSYGYQPAEIAQLMDHRTVLLARDAMKWRELQANKANTVKQVRDAPPVVKPGAATAQTDPNSKAGFQKFTQEFRKQGRAGNHRAQEDALAKVLARTFK
jgi:hypothetical protein